MSDLKVDGIIASTGTNTALTLQGKGTGKVDIGDGALSFPDADGDADQVIKTDGSGALSFVTPAAGGAWNIIGTEEAGGGSGTATLDVTGLSSTYDTYAIGLSDIVPITDNVNAFLRVGDSSGVDSGASDYAWWIFGENLADATAGNSSRVDNADAQIEISNDNNPIGFAAGEGIGGMIYLHRPGDGTTKPMLTGETYYYEISGVGYTVKLAGHRESVITLDRIQFLFSSGNVETGRMTVWGIAHA